MTFPMLSILIFFTLFSTTLTHTTEPSSFSPNLSNPDSEKMKKQPISFSTRVYSRRRHITRQPSNTSTFSPTKVSLDVHPYPSQVIVMVVGIGSNSTSTPMLTTELLVDTGSSLTWLQASQCTFCYDQGDFPYYDHNASMSYNPVYCFDEICKSAPQRPEGNSECNDLASSEEPCPYDVVYADGSISSGIVGTETFYFHENMLVKFVPFGLGMYNSIPSNFKGSAPGLVGLKRGGGLLNALGVKQFSHCFPREEEHTGILRFGEEAKIMGEKLVLTNNDEGYKANLTNVYVAGEQIPVEDGALPEITEFDTGTTWTYLSPRVMDAVVASIKVALRRHKPHRLGMSELCYKTTEMLSVDLDEVAKVTFEFGYTTKIDFLSFHVWVLLDQDSSTCLAFIRGNSGENIIGNHSMREVNIGYTLDEDDLAMYFNNQHCRKKVL